MKQFVTLTAKDRRLMYFQAQAYEEANYICGGFRYIELHTMCYNCVCIPKSELRGYEKELYQRLVNREYKTINQ